MIQRPSSTSSRGPRRHVGSRRGTGLVPLLSGEAQMAAHQLPVQNLLVYDDLKRAILQRVGLNPRTTPSVLQITGDGGKLPTLHDGSAAPGRVPQMTVSRGRRLRPDHRLRCARTVHRVDTEENRTVGSVPLLDVVRPGHPAG